MMVVAMLVVQVGMAFHFLWRDRTIKLSFAQECHHQNFFVINLMFSWFIFTPTLFSTLEGMIQESKVNDLHLWQDFVALAGFSNKQVW